MDPQALLESGAPPAALPALAESVRALVESVRALAESGREPALRERQEEAEQPAWRVRASDVRSPVDLSWMLAPAKDWQAPSLMQSPSVTHSWLHASRGTRQCHKKLAC